jgi:hypothetical protein
MSKITYNTIPDFGNPKKPERRKRIETMMAWIGMTDVKDLEPGDRQRFLDIIDGKINKKSRLEEILVLNKAAQEIEEPEEEEEKFWYRMGDPSDYSEFTFDPTGEGGPPMMTGGRGSGFASGQYAFGDPGEGRVKVPVPKNPLRIGGGLRPNKAVYGFQDDAISMMRFAEAYDRLGEINRFDRHGHAGTTLGTLTFSMSAHAPQHVGRYSQTAEKHVEQAIKDWSMHKQVHPMNILLSRWGYDGVEWVGTADWAAKSGTFGNVTFPQIDEEGRVEGLEALSRKYMRRKAGEEEDYIIGLITKPSEYEQLLLKHDIIPYRDSETGSSFVNQGAHSAVFRVIYNDTPAVAKITSDQTEPEIFMSKEYQNIRPEFKKHLPQVYEVIEDKDSFKYIVVLEELVPITEDIQEVWLGSSERYQNMRFDPEITFSAIKKSIEHANDYTKRKLSLESIPLDQGQKARLALNVFKVMEQTKNFQPFHMFAIFNNNVKKILEGRYEDDQEGYDIVTTFAGQASRYLENLLETTGFPEWAGSGVGAEQLEETRWSETPETKGVMKSLQKLRELGIEWGDLHEDNVMLRPSTGDLVISDFSLFSKINKVAEHLTYRQPFFRQNYDYEGDFVERLKKRLKALNKKKKKAKKTSKAFMTKKKRRFEMLEGIITDPFYDIRNNTMVVSKGDTEASGKPVKLIQQKLMELGYDLPEYGADGSFGEETDVAIRKFQADNGLVQDGIVGINTIAKLAPELATPGQPPATLPGQPEVEGELIYKGRDIAPLAAQVGISPLFMEAVLRVESAGKSNAIRFEPHLFNRKMDARGGQDRVPMTLEGGRVYSTRASETNEKAFWHAFGIDPRAAVESTSWGSGQVMGKHLLNVIPDPGRAVKAFFEEPQGMSDQLMAAWFRDNPGAVTAANNLDFAGFAKIYNGPLYWQGKYDQKIQSAYEKAKRKNPAFV